MILKSTYDTQIKFYFSYTACIQDIRLNNGWFPMDFSENDLLDAVAELKENPNVDEGCVRNDCLAKDCPAGRVCYPLWEAFECRYLFTN